MLKKLLLAVTALLLLSQGAFAQGTVQAPNLFWATPASGTGFLALRAIALSDLSGTTSNIAASTLLGNPAGSAAPAQPITINSPLLFSGTSLGLSAITNAQLANSGTTVNGVLCTLGSTCTISSSAGTITPGTTTIASGTPNGLLYDNAAVLGNLATGNNGVLITSGAGVPSISSTIPAATQANITTLGTIAGLTVTGSLTATGLITNADLANSGTTINGVLCTLGSTCTLSSSGAPLNILSFGADPTGVADSTAAIASAIAATPYGDELDFPSGTYKIAGAGTGNCLFQRNTPIRLIGKGYPLLLEASTIPSTTNIFCFNPSGNQLGNEIANLSIEGGFGKDVLHFTFSTSGQILSSTIHDNVITGTPGGVSLYADNVTSPNDNGGFFDTYISRNNFDSISLLNVGDGMVVEDNLIFGSTPGRNGIYSYLHTGAGNIKITGNVVAVLGGLIVFDGGVGPIIENNELETPGGTNTHGSMIDIASLQAPTVSGMIINNQIQALASTGNPIPINIRAGSGDIHISGGRLERVTGPHINVASGATNTNIDPNTIQFNTNDVPGAMSLTNAGTNTVVMPLMKYPLTQDLPLTADASGNISQGTRSGNTAQFVTQGASKTSGTCAQYDASGNVSSSGASCGGGGGSGTVNSGTLNQIAYYAAAGTVVSGETLLQAVNFPALTGDITTAGGTLATVLATVNSTPGSFGGSNSIPTFTSNGKGLMTASGAVTPSIPTTELTGTLQSAQEPAHTGDVTNSAGAIALTIAANAVTYSKFQQVAASSLVGNPTGSLANAQGITLGAALTFSGTALQTAAMTGDITTPANSLVTTLATVNANTGSFGSSTAIPNFTVNGKGLITAAGTNAIIAPAGTLTGATLAAGVTASSLTSVGTLVNLGLSGPINESQSIGATSTDGLLLANPTAAGAGAQKWAPRVHWTGQGWKTNATAGSQTVDIIEELQPVQGAANPTGNLVWSSSINGGAYGVLLTLGSGGGLNLNSGNYQIGGAQIAFSNIASTAACGQLPALTGDITSSGCATTLATVTVPKGGTGATTFTANRPLIGNGASALAQGTNSGNTTQFVTQGASKTSGTCAQYDANGNITSFGVGCGVAGGLPPLEHGGRLTLVSGGPVMVSNNASQTILYYAPYKSQFIAIYNGANVTNYNFTSGPTDAVGLSLGTFGSGWAASTVYDVFVALSGGVPVLCTGPAWTNFNTRTAAGSLATYSGQYVNSNASSMTCRTSNAATISVPQYQATYLGTILTDASVKLNWTPQNSTCVGTSCGPATLYVWNNYNRVTIYAYVFDNTVSPGLTYAGAVGVIRTAGANVNNRIYYIVGQVEDTCTGYYQAFDNVVTAGGHAISGFWYNAASTPGATQAYVSNSPIYAPTQPSGGTTFRGVSTSFFNSACFPIGLDYEEALEESDGNNNQFGYFGQQVLEFSYPM